MASKIDYYALLARAVASLAHSSYAARGAIYDRAHDAMLRRLAAADPPCTDAELVAEELAFRDAVKRIEFPESEASPRPVNETPVKREKRREPPAQPAESEWEPPGPVADETTDAEPKRRRLLGKLAARALVAALLLIALGVGYAQLKGAIDLSWLARIGGQSVPAQRAVLREVGKPGDAGIAGRAIWRTRTESSGGKGETVVVLDVEMAQPKLALSMTLSRNSEASGGMSHLFEIRFADPDNLPFGGVSRIAGIAMKNGETEAGEDLVGSGVGITPGDFLFGLLELPDIVRENMQLLKTRSWLAITIAFMNGQIRTLAVEKGPAGERAINEALDKWGQ
jgi:hypothetical protein